MTYAATYPPLVPGHLYAGDSFMFMVLATKTDEGDDWMSVWITELPTVDTQLLGFFNIVEDDTLEVLMNCFDHEMFEDITL